MTKHPQIGFENALQYLNDVLYPAYARFSARETRTNALEIAQAAWALHERLWHDEGRKPDLAQFRTDLFKDCPELELMRDYAEAGKHFGLDRPTGFVGIQGAENPGGTLEIFSPFGMTTTVPTCTLTMEYSDGKTYSVPIVLKRVVEFWSNKLR
jgi:hypothetical protein